MLLVFKDHNNHDILINKKKKKTTSKNSFNIFTLEIKRKWDRPGVIFHSVFGIGKSVQDCFFTYWSTCVQDGRTPSFRPLFIDKYVIFYAVDLIYLYIF